MGLGEVLIERSGEELDERLGEKLRSGKRFGVRLGERLIKQKGEICWVREIVGDTVIGNMFT